MTRRDFCVAVWLLIALAAAAMVAIVRPAAGHTLESAKLQLAAIRHCESGGYYQAVNESSSEYHPQWDVTGSFGAYQIAQPLWDEQALRNDTGPHPLSSWAGMRPDRAPPYIQDLIALSLYDDYYHSTEGIGLLWQHKGEC